MTHKQQLSHRTLPQKGVLFSRILLLGVAATATSVVTMVAPRPARAQVMSPVSPAVVNPPPPSTLSLGGTSLSDTTTTETTETTTTTGETTTTTTTTVTETTTTTTTETEVGVEATTTVVDDTATTAVAPEAVPLQVVQEAAPQNTGEIMTTTAATTTPTAPTPTQATATTQQPSQPQATQPQATQPQATQPQAAVTATATTTVVEQFVIGTTIETLYLRGLAGRLGTSQDILLQTRVFQVVVGVRGNQTALLQAFQAALERAGILNLAAYNNAAFADLIANSGNAELAIEVFSRLAANRLLLLSRLGGLSSLSARRGLVGVRFARITITQYVVYQGLGTRFMTFPREREK